MVVGPVSFEVVGATDDPDGGCSSCGGGAQTGEPQQPKRPTGSLEVFNPSGPDVRIGLGADDFEKDAGFLNIRATVASVDLGKPAGLSVPLEADNVQVLRTNNIITQVKAPQGLVNVAVETASQYHLLVYHPANVTTNGSAYSTNGNPFVVYTVTYVSAAVPLKVTEIRSGWSREHQFAYNSQNGHWTLTDDQSARATESWTESNLGGDPNRSQYHHEVKVGGQTVRAVARTYEKTWVGDSEPTFLIESVEGAGGLLRTNSYRYNGYGKLERVVYPDGNWEYRKYNQDEQLTGLYTAWGPDSPAPGEGSVPDPSQTRYKLTE
ncbi:MAG: hypothetical protein QM286_10330, partial [Acidobacteriota bacterium]|nr:hypothetical protein [Acidobacteriota bacterium]